MLQTVSEWLYWERLWLPENVSWSDLEDKEDRVYAKASHLYAVLPCALCLLVVRYLFERYLATPLANAWGIKDKVRLTAKLNPVLEKFFCQTRNPSQADVSSLCKKTSWPQRRIEVWFRRRRNQDRPGLQKRFCEASWRCVFYLLAFLGGILALYDKPWFYHIKEVWTDFPKQHPAKSDVSLPLPVYIMLITAGPVIRVSLWLIYDEARVLEFQMQSMLPSQHWYYIMEMGFYLSLLLSLTFDVKRKDFKEQVIHHVATLTLLGFSWVSNYIRIGTIVMALHDSADVLLEGGKLFNYAKWEQAANAIFVVFTTVFMVTRLVIFPFWVIHCTWVYALEIISPFFGYYFFNFMLSVLQILHIYWAFLILRMLYMCIFVKLEGDLRSDEEEEEDSDPPTEKNDKPGQVNGCSARGRASGH